MMKIIGHRGAKGLAPENTLASFAKALEHGVDAIELDVRVTLDDVAIVHHNPAVRDPSGHRLDVVGHTHQELRAHQPALVTLDEALRAIKRQVPVRIEVKPGVPIKPISWVLEGLFKDAWLPADFLLGSKDQALLRELHTAHPAIQKFVIERWSSLRAVHRAKQVDTTLLHMNAWWLWGPVIRGLTKHGYELAPYTLNNTAKAKRWQKHGLSAIITDFPDRFTGR
ncbi:MAG: glycerophosphodiester phosphodiesterase [Candidatus Saccharibacteria bacterium]|nr:glycerophosphodiester phosphodiesterase [Candidatus Saccharibacteria bacterium]